MENINEKLRNMEDRVISSNTYLVRVAKKRK